MRHPLTLRTARVVAATCCLLGSGLPLSEAWGQGLDPNVPPVTEGAWYRPAVDVTWQWQLSGTINTTYSVEVYDVDLFDTPVEVLTALHAQGRKVICYFSAGSAENWRPDYGQFQQADLGQPLDGWEGERWLDIRTPNVLAVMLSRLDRAVQRGCDGVEPDNVDGYTNDSGFALTAIDQLAFNRRLANEAHTRGLAVALKNDGDQAAELVAYFDFELNEECHAFEECGQLQVFLDRGQPVLNVEYAEDRAGAEALAAVVCPSANAAGLRTLILPLDLDDSFRVSCFEASGTPIEPLDVPASFRLDQNYPNPFNPATMIRFSVPAPVHVRLTVYDAVGQAVAVLVDERRPPGTYTVPFDATGLPSGVYVYRLDAGGFAATRTMLLVK